MQRPQQQMERMNQKIAVSVVFVSAMFMSIMDSTIVNVALPTIGRTFHVFATSVDTVSIFFLVSLAVFIPASGWLGDRFGAKRVLLSAIVIFTASSALCGLASSLPELVVFRVVQGMGGGMLAPVGMAMLFRTFPPDERIRASGILTVPTTLAPALGPVVGGLLVTDLSWRWVFYVNLPIGIAALAFGIVFLEPETAHLPGRFDLPGFVLSGAGLGLLMYGVSEGPIEGWHSSDVLATIAAGVVLLAADLVVELRVDHPLLDLRLLKNHLFGVASAVTILGSSAFIGTMYLTSIFLQDGRGTSALDAGLSTFPEALGVMVGAQLASRYVYRRLGPRRHITAGLVGIAGAIALLSTVGGTTSLWWLRLFMFGLGICMGQVFVPSQAIAFATISPAATSRASTLFNATRQLGGAVGVALLTTAAVAVGTTTHVGTVAHPDLSAYHAAYYVALALALLGTAASLRIRDAEAAGTMPRRRARRPVEQPEPEPSMA